MGEYAIRKSDKQKIKIGTCESMYYLRFEDRDKVKAQPGSVDVSRDSEAAQLLFRVPFPDEDGILPGDYEDYGRGMRLYKYEPCRFCEGTGKHNDVDCFRCHGNGKEPYAEDFRPLASLSDPGTIQLKHECGMLLNVPCYHGIQLPESNQIKPFWNGKSWFFELMHLRCVSENGGLVLYPVVGCRWCRHLWRFDWADIWAYIPDDKLKARLMEQCNLPGVGVGV